MLPKKHRLNRAQFGKVFSSGTLLHSEHFSIKWTDVLGNIEPRFAVVVSKKVSRSSVGRNRIRRRYYEMLRGLLSQVPEGTAGIILIRPRAASLPPWDLEKELEELLFRMRVVS